jgi:hypothetical protein
MADQYSDTNSGNQGQEQNTGLEQGMYEKQGLYTGPQAQSKGLDGSNMNEGRKPNNPQENVYAETTDGLGYQKQAVQSPEESGYGENSDAFTQPVGQVVYGEAPGQTGHRVTPNQGVRPVTQPAQQWQADTEQAQNWEREQQAGEVPGQEVGPTTGKNFEHTAGITGNFSNTPGQQEQEEQEGQKVNVEQAHDANTAQYTGKPGVKAPSPGEEQGTAWSQDMELGNENVPARDPDSY